MPLDVGLLPALLPCLSPHRFTSTHCCCSAGVADPHMPQAAEAAVSHWRSVIDTNLSGGSGSVLSCPCF
jgi:hypothetical protein